jgi:hypothetical protein
LIALILLCGWFGEGSTLAWLRQTRSDLNEALDDLETVYNIIDSMSGIVGAVACLWPGLCEHPAVPSDPPTEEPGQGSVAITTTSITAVASLSQPNSRTAATTSIEDDSITAPTAETTFISINGIIDAFSFSIPLSIIGLAIVLDVVLTVRRIKRMIRSVVNVILGYEERISPWPFSFSLPLLTDLTSILSVVGAWPNRKLPSAGSNASCMQKIVDRIAKLFLALDAYFFKAIFALFGIGIAAALLYGVYLLVTAIDSLTSMSTVRSIKIAETISTAGAVALATCNAGKS